MTTPRAFALGRRSTPSCPERSNLFIAKQEKKEEGEKGKKSASPLLSQTSQSTMSTGNGARVLYRVVANTLRYFVT